MARHIVERLTQSPVVNPTYSQRSRRVANGRSVRSSWSSFIAFSSSFGVDPGLFFGVIPNPVVEYAYAKENRGVASCDQGRVGAPLQEGSRPRRTLSLSDRMAAE